MQTMRQSLVRSTGGLMDVTITTSDGKIVASRVIGRLEKRSVRSGSRTVERWFHDLVSPDQQRMGLGYAKKQDCLDAAVAEDRQRKERCDDHRD